MPLSKHRIQAFFALVLFTSVFSILKPDMLLADDAPYKLGPGDTLQVLSYDDEKLSGRRRVSPNGTVALPFIGEVQIAGLTTEEAGHLIAERLSEYVPSARALAVEVVEYAPVYVVGDVEKPGAYSYAPGMLAVELLALGGGLKRLQTEANLVSTINLEQDIADQRLLLFSQRTQYARLVAESEGRSFDPARVEPDDFIRATDRQGILEAETQLAARRAMVIADAIRSLEAQRSGYDNQIKTLTESIALHDEEISYIQKEVESVEDLFKKGFAIQPRYLGLKRELSSTRRNALDMRLALARANQARLEIDQRIEEVRSSRASENAIELRRLNLEIPRTEQHLAAVIAALSEALGRTARPKEPRVFATNLIVERLGKDGTRTSQAVDDLAAIMPRDILRVERAARIQPEGSTAEAQIAGSGG